MVWHNWTDYLSMGGYASYVWGAVLVFAVALGAEVFGLRSRRRSLLQRHAQAVSLSMAKAEPETPPAAASSARQAP